MSVVYKAQTFTICPFIENVLLYHLWRNMQVASLVLEERFPRTFGFRAGRNVPFSLDENGAKK